MSAPAIFGEQQMPDLADLPRILERVIELAMQAGQLIEAELARPDGPRGGGDKAEVDMEIEGMLRPGLMQLLECDFVGEETGISLSGDAFCWVVDPNDGTADFLQGRSGSAVSIGLLHAGLPVLGGSMRQLRIAAVTVLPGRRGCRHYYEIFSQLNGI